MTIRQYWVHYDEPIHPNPAQPSPAPATTLELPPTKQWETLLPPLYRAALHLLAGRQTPLPPLPT